MNDSFRVSLKINTITVPIDSRVEEQSLDRNEEIAVHKYHYDDIQAMVQNRRITQLFTVSTYYMAKEIITKGSI